MMHYYASYSKGQLKVQQMAFVLVALAILFGMVLLLYFSITLRSMGKEALELNREEAGELVKSIASSAEFGLSDCPNCVDLDKLMLLKYRNSYKEFWNLDYLRIDKIYPIANEKECELSNYPECSTITLIKKEVGSPSSAFVSLCRWEREYRKCELGRIYASGKGLEQNG